MSKRKLLLADDSITIQKVVNLTFADEGIEVIAVGDGDSAMRKFDEFMPDLVMADVNMPGLNGYEVCRIIKQTDETRNIPVILLVGSFEPFNEDEAKDVGADDFLTKPFQSIRQLVNKVTDLLNRQEQPDEAPTETPAAPAVDSFADTLELEKHEEAQSEFGDAGMDDEMIETSPANDYFRNSDSAYQRETTIDYAKTQPLNAEDLKGFDIVSKDAQTFDSGEQNDALQQSTTDAEQTENADDSEEISAPEESAAEPETQSSAPPSFDEEARKMGFYDSADESYDRDQYSYGETENFNDYSAREESFAEIAASEQPANLSQNEQQIDYTLPVDEPQIEEEISDAETLAPKISYDTESPREAVFSQATEEPESAPEEFSQNEESAAPTVESEELAIESSENADTEETAPAESVDEQASETVEEIQAGDEESENVSQVETSEPEETEPEQLVSEESTVEETAEALSQTEEPAAEEFEEKMPEISAAETETVQDAEEEDVVREPEMIDETPISTPVGSAEVPPLDFTDDDLLDLPPLVEETGIRPQPVASAVVPEVVAPQMQTTEPESRITVTKTVAESEIALHFPPELIEAIAQKVADKISQKTLSEVLPQITELVVQKLAEQESKK